MRSADVSMSSCLPSFFALLLFFLFSIAAADFPPAADTLQKCVDCPKTLTLSEIYPKDNDGWSFPAVVRYRTVGTNMFNET